MIGNIFFISLGSSSVALATYFTGVTSGQQSIVNAIYGAVLGVIVHYGVRYFGK